MGLVMSNPPGGAPLPAEPTPDWHSALAGADIAAGRKIFERCAGCHDLTRAAHNGIGPGLYGVLDRPRAGRPGFIYSAAMTASGGRWTLDSLFAFLRAPQLYIPGTRMNYAGVPDAQERINLLAFMRENSDASPPTSASAPF